MSIKFISIKFSLLTLILLIVSWGSVGTINQSAQPQSRSKLHVVVEGAKNDRGNIVLAIFNNQQDFTRKPYREKNIATLDAARGIIFNDLPDGDYAVVIFHDENANEMLDRNFLGVPKEGIAFSNNLPVKFSLPEFNEAKVALRGHSAIKITLNYL